MVKDDGVALQTTNNLSYSQAQVYKNDYLWQKMSQIQVQQELKEWLDQYSSHTRQTYFWHITALEDLGLIEVYKTLDYFSLVNHDEVVDKIKTIQHYDDQVCEGTKQSRAAAYISFTRFLSRKYQGKIQRASPNVTNTNKTFFKLRDKCATEAMTCEQWKDWLYELESKKREWLIAVLILQGAKRLNEVLEATIDQIDWTTCKIKYKQSKAKRMEKYTTITYPKRIMEQLKDYLSERKEGLIFITSTGKKVDKKTVYIAFVEAGRKANIPFVVHPHVLRASAITYFKSQGYSSDEIQKISGHTSVDSVNMYDKSSGEHNATEEISLV